MYSSSSLSTGSSSPSPSPLPSPSSSSSSPSKAAATPAAVVSRSKRIRSSSSSSSSFSSSSSTSQSKAVKKSKKENPASRASLETSLSSSSSSFPLCSSPLGRLPPDVLIHLSLFLPPSHRARLFSCGHSFSPLSHPRVWRGECIYVDVEAVRVSEEGAIILSLKEHNQSSVAREGASSDTVSSSAASASSSSSRRGASTIASSGCSVPLPSLVFSCPRMIIVKEEEYKQSIRCIQRLIESMSNLHSLHPFYVNQSILRTLSLSHTHLTHLTLSRQAFSLLSRTKDETIQTFALTSVTTFVFDTYCNWQHGHSSLSILSVLCPSVTSIYMTSSQKVRWCSDTHKYQKLHCDDIRRDLGFKHTEEEQEKWKNALSRLPLVTSFPRMMPANGFILSLFASSMPDLLSLDLEVAHVSLYTPISAGTLHPLSSLSSLKHLRHLVLPRSEFFFSAFPPPRTERFEYEEEEMSNVYKAIAQYAPPSLHFLQFQGFASASSSTLSSISSVHTLIFNEAYEDPELEEGCRVMFPHVVNIIYMPWKVRESELPWMKEVEEERRRGRN